ncbi:MAG: aminopeptidase, partial [Bdellovibrionales bacterium]|nr:aminopeptidase [Bdellovibrionales bacterium]
KLVSQIEKAAESSGEWVWQMPLVPDHLKDMKGVYADLNNISSIGGAGSAKGAAFLSEFVPPEIPWAHFDVAGTAWHIGHRVNYAPDKGASGIMLRTFIELARASQ